MKEQFEVLCVAKGILSLTTASYDECSATVLRSVDFDTKFRISETPLRSDSRWASPVYHDVPTRPPLRRYKFRLTPLKGQTTRSRDNQEIDDIESQVHLLSVN